MSYELRAAIGSLHVAGAIAEKLEVALVALGDHLGLVPVTDAVLARVGEVGAWTLPESFWSLSAGLDDLLRAVSSGGRVAYVEADLFGGIGTQAAIGWLDDAIALGPVRTEFQWPPTATSRRAGWAFNQALRWLGVTKADAIDEFDAIGLGRHRHTDHWVTGPP